MMISVAFVLAVATSAQAMSPAPLHEPDDMITQVRGLVGGITWAKCWNSIEGISMVFACFMPALSPQPSTYVWHGGTAFALSTMGRSRGGGQRR